MLLRAEASTDENLSNQIVNTDHVIQHVIPALKVKTASVILLETDAGHR